MDGDRVNRGARAGDDRLGRARSVLTLVEQLVGPRAAGRADQDQLGRLRTAEDAVEQELLRSVQGGDAQRAVLLRALAEQVRFVRASIVDVAGHPIAGPAGATNSPIGGCSIGDVRRALGRLRSFTSVSELVARAPAELGRLGYTRALVSRIEDGSWVARSAYARDVPELATALVTAGQVPRQLDGSLLETEMVRRRRPMLVADPQHSHRTYRELVAITGTEAYVAAPLVSQGGVVGLLHADRDADAGRVGDSDRELLGSFAEGFGLALDRAVSLRRLRELRGRLAVQLGTVGDLLEEFTELAGSGLALSDEPPAPAAPARQVPGSRWSDLTPREYDVLRAMAEGRTNGQIAAGLFLSEATVKFHVKNVLRKTGAANRADAVSRYHRSTSNG